MSAPLEASTVTPGSTLPLASVTVPAIVCAAADTGRSITSAIHSAKQQVDRVIETPPLQVSKGG
jgi:hypothetical protein